MYEENTQNSNSEGYVKTYVLKSNLETHQLNI